MRICWLLHTVTTSNVGWFVGLQRLWVLKEKKKPQPHKHLVQLYFCFSDMLISVLYWFLQTETALMYDAVHLFSKALHELSRAAQIDTTSLSCTKSKTWSNGESLLNYMKMVSEAMLIYVN